MMIPVIPDVRVPNPGLKILQRLAKTLVIHKLEIELDTPTVNKAADRLVEYVVVVDGVLTARVREANPQQIASDAEFDRADDGLWIWLRKLLAGWAKAYAHPGLDLLTPERAAKVELPKLRERSRIARDLHRRLFAAQGTRFVRRAYIVQSEEMGALLRLIKEDELQAPLEAVVGPELVKLIHVCQEQYEEMVGDRMRREGGSAEDLNDHRARLRFLIHQYKNAVETLLDDQDLDSFERVEQALRPLILLNERLATRAPTQGDDDTDFDDLLVDLDAELGEDEGEDEDEGEGEDAELGEGEDAVE